MVYQVTLAVGKGFEGQLSYLVNDFYVLTLTDGIPSMGVGRSMSGGGVWYTGYAPNNPGKHLFYGRAEGVCDLIQGGVGADRGCWGGFLAPVGGDCD